MNLLSCERDLIRRIKKKPGTSIHGSLPCTAWCLRQYQNLKLLGAEFQAKLEREREASVRLLESFIRIAEVCMKKGGTVLFEWPKTSTGWVLAPLIAFIGPVSYTHLTLPTNREV